MPIEQGGTTTRTTTSVDQQPQSAAELREQIRESVREATEAARAARGQGQGIGRGIGVPVPPPPPGIGPGITIDRGFEDSGFPPQLVDISIGFFVMCAVMVIGWPLARAFGRRIERKAAEPAALNPQMAEQLQRIEQAVDAMSVEIERISESQRYIAKLQSGRVAEPAVPSSPAGSSFPQRGAL
jgi:hypothetical protein